MIFLRRSRHYKTLLQAISFVGVVVPVMIGGLVLGFGTGASFLPRLIPVAVGMGVIQLALSVWSLAYSVTDKLDYAAESASDNLALSLRFKELGLQAPDPPADLATKYAEVKSRDDARRDSDSKKGVSEAELRYGHRAGLRQYQRQCVGCKQVPLSMKSTDCEVCGKFGRF